MSAKTAFKFPSFLKRGKIGPYLSVVMSGQITYSSFEAFKGALLVPLAAMLGISMEQFGILMGWIGIAMFLYVPGGWVNNRFTIKSILIAWCAWRFVTYMILFLVPGLSFNVMIAIAISWAVWDAIGWPAVVNGVAFISENEDTRGRGMAMGLLETIRRGAELAMNAVIVVFIGAKVADAKTIMWVFAIGYAFLLLPMIACIWKFVPKNAIAKKEGTSDNVAALIGLVKVLSKPRVWFAAGAALCVYWTYVNLIYCSAPYMKFVYHASDSVSATFGILNTGLVGVFAGLVSGFAADYLFRSSTMMMAVSLTITAIGAVMVYMLPVSSSTMMTSMVLLMIMAVGVFMGKAVILAPVAELHLPESINGSAMSVGSFLAYASVLWANRWNGHLVDVAKLEQTKNGVEQLSGFNTIFIVTIVVSIVGAALAYALAYANHRIEKNKAAKEKTAA